MKENYYLILINLEFDSGALSSIKDE